MIDYLTEHDGVSRRIIEQKYTAKDYWEAYGFEARKGAIHEWKYPTKKTNG